MSEEVCRQIAEDVVELSVGSAKEAQSVAKLLRAQNTWRDVVPGLATVTAVFDPVLVSAETVKSALKKAAETAPHQIEEDASVIKISVRYGGADGPDLPLVCEALQITEADFILTHTSAQHSVDMIGFTPGFAYISGIEASLSVPRKAAPRPRLPAGSVGVSGTYTGIYALAGPGGWPIIGRTESVLLDPGADDPFLLQPGQRVSFEAI